MIEEVNTLWKPNPTVQFRAVWGPTIAKWNVHTRRTTHVAELFQDLARHPEVGVRQAGRASNLYTNTARGVDQELRALPYEQRLNMTRGGLWPIVVGGELGEGPNPWSAMSNKRYARDVKMFPRDGGGGGGGGGPPNMMDQREPSSTRPQGPAAPAGKATPLPGPRPPGLGGGAAPKDVDAMAGTRRRSFSERLANVGKHALNSAGEVGLTGGAAGAAAYFTGDPRLAKTAGTLARFTYAKGAQALGIRTGVRSTRASRARDAYNKRIRSR